MKTFFPQYIDLHYRFSILAFWFFQKNETIVSLRISGNKIGNKGGMFFAQMLQVNETLEYLDLGDTDLVSWELQQFNMSV